MRSQRGRDSLSKIIIQLFVVCVSIYIYIHNTLYIYIYINKVYLNIRDTRINHIYIYICMYMVGGFKLPLWKMMTFPRAVHLVKSITHKEGLSCPSTKRSAKVVLKHRTGCRFRSDAHSSWVTRDFYPLNLIEDMESLWDITHRTSRHWCSRDDFWRKHGAGTSPRKGGVFNI
jgi:hypothetical protein